MILTKKPDGTLHVKYFKENIRVYDPKEVTAEKLMEIISLAYDMGYEDGYSDGDRNGYDNAMASIHM